MTKKGSKYSYKEVVLGMLPQSHIYALIVISHASIYRGDQVINLPKFDFSQVLRVIQRFKINYLCLVSSIEASLLGWTFFGGDAFSMSLKADTPSLDAGTSCDNITYQKQILVRQV